MSFVAEGHRTTKIGEEGGFGLQLKVLKGCFPEGMFTPDDTSKDGNDMDDKDNMDVTNHKDIFYMYVMWGIELKGFRRQAYLSSSQGQGRQRKVQHERQGQQCRQHFQNHELKPK